MRIARKDVAALSTLPNVVAVRGLQLQTPGNETSVPFLGIPGEVWEDLGYTGTGVKIAVIDTGIDYTHANFGGPGTVEAYEAANAADITVGGPEDAAWFGAAAPKVKGGYDFVGDDYDAAADDGSGQLIPHPDPDPLDCVYTDGSSGHGSHVSGTATGFGVLADGSTYTGPYDSSAYDNDFEIGPGVAPEAELYGLRVFGCDGSTDVTVEAIDWAVEHDMDVINMSLGSSFGRGDDPSAVASTNAAASGVIVVASAGNSGPAQYITGSPATGTGAISTAAVDSTQNFPGVKLDFNTGSSIVTLSANGVAPPDGTVYDIVVLQDIAGTPNNERLGCSVEAFTLNGIAEGDDNVLAVTERGVCARVARAVFGEQAGAGAVAMINTSAGYPPYEGPIAGNPDDGEAFEVTIPFLGVKGPLTSADAVALRAASTATTTIVGLPNPGFRGFASFSSGGPRNGDSALKPDIAAPGVSIMSTASGTGTKGHILSGTSMASPHVAGVAALVRQAHPDWTVEEAKAAIVNTGDPNAMAGYSVTRAGTGLVSTAAAISTPVVALGDMVVGDPALGLADFHNSNLSFGFEELGANYSATRQITLRNFSTDDVTLGTGSAAGPGARPHSVAFGAGSVVVPAGGETTLSVTLGVPAGTVGNSAGFRQVSGNVVLTGDEVTLRVPYLLVPRALSTIETSGKLTANGKPSTFTVTNPNGVIAGTADVYQWGLEDGNDVNEAVLGGAGYDLQAAGVQSFDFGGGEQLIVFALSTHDRWSNAAVNEYDVSVDVDGDKQPDYIVIGFDLGALTTGSFNGIPAAFVLDLATGGLSSTGWPASAPTDSSTYLLPVLASDIGLTAANGGFSYGVESYSLEGAGSDAMRGIASFDPWNPALVSDEEFPYREVAPGGSATFELALDAKAYAKQKPLGVMIVSPDDAAGAEVQLISVPGSKKGN
ncbi:MAG: S8 family serine peptidase [Candidatus Limnocylindria bacterium]